LVCAKHSIFSALYNSTSHNNNNNNNTGGEQEMSTSPLCITISHLFLRFGST
jgi:hypothetical protein